MRTLILNLHLFLALTAGIFMVFLGITGSIMEFVPELDRSLHPRLSYITPGGHVLPLREIGDSVSRRFSEPVVAFLPSRSPSLALQVILPSGIAYVNQYTGAVLGERMRGPTFFGYVRSLHTRLGGGDLGRNILKWSAVAMIFSLGSGLYLWWPLKRVRVRADWGSRRLWGDLHNAIGIFALLPMAILTVTGAAIGFEDQLAPLIYRVTGSHPIHTVRKSSLPPEPGIELMTPDEAITIARAYLPGAEPYRVQMPNYGGAYQIEFRSPNDFVSSDRNLVVLDPYRGNLLSLTRASDLTRGESILATNEAIHTGTIFGTPSRIIVWLASMMVFVQMSTGLIAWLYRKGIVLRDNCVQKEEVAS